MEATSKERVRSLGTVTLLIPDVDLVLLFGRRAVFIERIY
jgi:hypothetical protein